MKVLEFFQFWWICGILTGVIHLMNVILKFRVYKKAEFTLKHFGILITTAILLGPFSFAGAIFSLIKGVYKENSFDKRVEKAVNVREAIEKLVVLVGGR